MSGIGKGKGWRRDRKMPRYTCVKCGKVGTTRIMYPVMGTAEVPVNAGKCKRECGR